MTLSVTCPDLKVDLDLGNYERFLDITLTRDNNLTTGKVYQVSCGQAHGARWRAAPAASAAAAPVCSPSRACKQAICQLALIDCRPRGRARRWQASTTPGRLCPARVAPCHSPCSAHLPCVLAESARPAAMIACRA